MSIAVRLVVNPTSGRGKAERRIDPVAARLSAGGLDVEVCRTKSLLHAAELAAEVAGVASSGGRGFDGAEPPSPMVVAMGGDGLVGAVARGLVGTGEHRHMGVVPVGRGNDFARAVGIGSERAGVDAVVRGVDRVVDVGRADGVPFLCIAGVGFDSRVIERAERLRWVRGPLVYPLATVMALRGWRPARFTVDVDGTTHEVEGYGVAVANGGAYGGGMWLAPDARLDDGLLDVVAIRHVPWTRFLRQGPKVFSGRHVENPEVSVWRGRSVRINVDRPFTLYADGEPVRSMGPQVSDGEPSMVIDVVPRALTVRVPLSER